jgi:FMN reductase
MRHQDGNEMALMVCINGSPRRDSRTALLVSSVAKAVQQRIAIERHDITMSASAPHIFSGLTRDGLSPAGERLCRLVEVADLLIVASPVYRASYTGILKHLFDLVDRDVMRGRKAIIVSTGGTPLHGLVMEHQFRPLMGFFGIQTVATALYGLEEDFSGGEVIGAALAHRVQRAADEAAMLMRPAGLSTNELMVA